MYTNRVPKKRGYHSCIKIYNIVKSIYDIPKILITSNVMTQQTSPKLVYPPIFQTIQTYSLPSNAPTFIFFQRTQKMINGISFVTFLLTHKPSQAHNSPWTVSEMIQFIPMKYKSYSTNRKPQDAKRVDGCMIHLSSYKDSIC